MFWPLLPPILMPFSAVGEFARISWPSVGHSHFIGPVAATEDVDFALSIGAEAGFSPDFASGGDGLCPDFGNGGEGVCDWRAGGEDGG